MDPCPIYDWTTGAPDNGNDRGKFRAVPRLYPLHSLSCTLFYRVGNKERFKTTRGGRGIISIVRWNLRPVIFGAEWIKKINNLARNCQSRSKFLILCSKISTSTSRNPHKKLSRGGWLARKCHSRSKLSISLETSFLSLGPLESALSTGEDLRSKSSEKAKHGV